MRRRWVGQQSSDLWATTPPAEFLSQGGELCTGLLRVNHYLNECESRIVITLEDSESLMQAKSRDISLMEPEECEAVPIGWVWTAILARKLRITQPTWPHGIDTSPEILHSYPCTVSLRLHVVLALIPSRIVSFCAIYSLPTQLVSK